MKNKFKILMFLALVAFAFTSCKEDDPNVKACFTFTPEQDIQVGDTVYFKNCSEEGVTYAWSFGDTKTSTEANPFHIYGESGVYDVTLVATNAGITNSVTQKVNVATKLSYIVNYGGFSGDKSTISSFDAYKGNLQNAYYEAVNKVRMISSVQDAYEHNGNIYFMGNSTDQIFWVDAKTFKQTENAISTDIVKPRHCIAKGDYLYVSCWGGSVWTDPTVSYLAKVNLKTKAVEKKITLHHGPEGLEMVGNKLYAALNYTNKVAVIDLGTDAITYIELPSGNIPSYFEKDNKNNLFVNLGRAYGDNTTQTGIGYINTSTNKFEKKYDLDGVSSATYVDVFEFNNDYSKLYVMTSAYDANWNVSGSIAVFDVANKKFESDKLIGGISGINGVGFQNNMIFTFISNGTESNGKLVTYKEDGTKIKEYETGIAPFMLLKTK